MILFCGRRDNVEDMYKVHTESNCAAKTDSLEEFSLSPTNFILFFIVIFSVGPLLNLIRLLQNDSPLRSFLKTCWWEHVGRRCCGDNPSRGASIELLEQAAWFTTQTKTSDLENQAPKRPFSGSGRPGSGAEQGEDASERRTRYLTEILLYPENDHVTVKSLQESGLGSLETVIRCAFSIHLEILEQTDLVENGKLVDKVRQQVHMPMNEALMQPLEKYYMQRDSDTWQFLRKVHGELNVQLARKKATLTTEYDKKGFVSKLVFINNNISILSRHQLDLLYRAWVEIGNKLRTRHKVLNLSQADPEDPEVLCMVHVRGIRDMNHEDLFKLFDGQHDTGCAHVQIRERKNKQTGVDTSWALVTMKTKAGAIVVLGSQEELKTPKGTVLEINPYNARQASMSKGGMKKVQRTRRATKAWRRFRLKMSSGAWLMTVTSDQGGKQTDLIVSAAAAAAEAQSLKARKLVQTISQAALFVTTSKERPATPERAHSPGVDGAQPAEEGEPNGAKPVRCGTPPGRGTTVVVQ